jgi:long-chain acyl-CoA synthetase
LPQHAIVDNAFAMALRMGLYRTTQLAVLPLYHAHALGFGLMSALVTRGHLVFTDKFDPLAWAAVARAERVRFASVVPTFLPLLLKTRLRAKLVPELEALLVSSAPLSIDLCARFEDETGVRIVQGWGLSEYTNFACCLSPSDGEGDRRSLLRDSAVPSIGSPIVGTRVTIRDENGAELGEGQKGELWVEGPCRMNGYFGDPAASDAAMVDEWLRTGDEGYFEMRNGRPCFYVTGRIKETIIRSGEKYSPIAIERRLVAAAPELEGKIAVVGFSHTLHGEEVGAYVELATLPPELRNRIGAAVEAVPLDQRPKVVLHGPAPIPRTHTGKVQRRKLGPLFSAYGECRGAVRVELAPSS